MRKAAYILNIIETVICGILIVPLAWMIPMTIYSKKIMNDGNQHVAFGICWILFLNLISGILTLLPE